MSELLEKPKVINSQTASKSYIPNEILEHTHIGWENSAFVKNLLGEIPYPFSFQDVEKVMALYRVGSVKNGYRKGAVTFPFIDEKDNIHAIQVKQFDNANHTVATDALHSIIEKHHQHKNSDMPIWLKAYLQNEKKFTCLFGEHLLKKYPTNPVALVEAPKTAIIGSLYFGLPDNPRNFLWLAVYNKSSLNAKRCWPLKGRKVILFPDLAAYLEWEKKARDIESFLRNIDIKTSDFLEKRATETDKSNGLDLADYLMQYDWRSFRPEFKPAYFGVKSEKGVAPKHNLFFSGEISPNENNRKSGDHKILEEYYLSKNELLKLANETIGNNNHLHKDNIPHFEEMLGYGIIQEAKPLEDFYYLSGATPF
ncbi:MAG: DUF6371 domain-containing protein [Bacteroidales bacterium]|nr:DUF6371 domain-containing protein [Bacteroidales bacterium]MCF8456826.1 DUF6371 domain-containing protein [Bacteroidales bacterium]